MTHLLKPWHAPALAALALAAGCVTTGRNQAPEWVVNPAVLDATYPRSRYIVGLGVCGGAGERDLMSRQQAQDKALADIASMVEVQIKETVEEHDTEVVRNGRQMTQLVAIQSTRRQVTGLLSGAEIRATHFDPRALNWHAYAVLERARAGRGAVEAIGQRVARARQTLDATGRGPLAETVAMRSLGGLLTELDRLVVGVAVFAPQERNLVKVEVDRLRAEVERRATDAGRGVGVAVAVAMDVPGPSGGLKEAAEQALTRNGIRLGPSRTQELQVTVTGRTERQVGAVTLMRATTGARFLLREDGAVLVSGEVTASEATASRADTAEAALAKSLEKLKGELGRAVDAELQKRFRLDSAAP